MKIIKNCHIVNSEYDLKKIYDICIEDGKITEIGEKLDYNCEIIDAENNYVIPGLIDMNCKLCQSGYESKDNITKISQCASNGGYTTITTSPLTQPVIDNKAVVEYVFSKSKEQAKINIYPYGSMTKGCKDEDMADIGEMVLAGIVGISDGDKTIENTYLFRNILLYCKMFSVPIITTCLDADLAVDGVINLGKMSTKLGLKGIPKEAEDISVGRNIILSRSLDVNLHISYITTKNSVDLIKKAKDEKLKITCGTCPHYFMLTEDKVDNYNTLAKVMPPLKSDDDIKAIVQGIKEGIIDVISSGHSPATMDNKNVEFDSAAFGISSLETSFALSYTNLCLKEDLPFTKLVEVMSYNPAKILGFNTKGKVETGYDADLVIVNIDDEFEIDSSKFHSKAKHSPFDKEKVRGKILKTIVKGKVV